MKRNIGEEVKFQEWHYGKVIAVDGDLITVQLTNGNTVIKSSSEFKTNKQLPKYIDFWGNRYRVRIKGELIGYCKTPEEALKVRDDYLKKMSAKLRFLRSIFVFFLFFGIFTAPTVNIHFNAENNHIHESIANERSYLFTADSSFSENLICPIDFSNIKNEIKHFNSFLNFLYAPFFFFVVFKFFKIQKYEKSKVLNKYIRLTLFTQTVK